MSVSVSTSLVLSAAALVCLPTPLALPPVVTRDVRRRRSLRPAVRRALVAALGVFVAGLLLGLWSGWWGVLPGLAAGVLTLRLPERRTNAHRVDDRARLAVHADLLAACLDAGMSIGAALLAVPSGAAGLSPTAAPAADDPLRSLDAVAALLMLGADPETAWQPVAAHPDLGPLAAAARRSAAGGAGFADAVREHAMNLRSANAAAAERSAGRAGVAMTAPLGLCFLPAFLCLGLAPVVIGLVSTLDIF